MTSVEIRGSAGDLLHRTIARGVTELRQELDAADRSLPGFVWRELERYQRCGDPEEGFAWLHCSDCDHHRLVPLSCKTRAFCPACIGRRMVQTADRWVETLLPRVPVRQWVITVPWSRRKWLAFRPELARGVLAVALRQIFGWLEGEALAEHGLVGARCGAVTAEQRFASSLALNLHFHCLLPDGVFARGADGEVRFHRVRPHRTELEGLVQRIGIAAEAWLARHGTDDEPDPDDAQAVLISAAVDGRTAAGARAGAPAGTGRGTRQRRVLRRIRSARRDVDRCRRSGRAEAVGRLPAAPAAGEGSTRSVAGRTDPVDDA